MTSRSPRPRTSPADRSGRRQPEVHRGSRCRRVRLRALEPLEDRTLLSYSQAATALATDLQNIQTSINSSFNAASAVPILGTQVQQLAPVQNFANQIITTVTGPLNAATAPSDLAGRLTAAMINSTPNLLGPGGVQTADDGSGGFIVSADFHTDLAATGFASSFSFGLGKFFQAQLESQIQLKVGVDYLLTFDIASDQTVTLQPSNLQQVAPSLPANLQQVDPSLPATPLAFRFDALMTDFKAEGTLNGLMHATLTTPGQGNSVDFKGNFGVDITPTGGPNFVTDVSLNATLDLPLHIDLSFAPNAPINPRLAGDFRLVWGFAGSDIAGSNQNSFGTIQTLEISGLSLDLGDLLPGFVTSIVSDVQRITEPLQPLVDFVNTEVPGLNDIGVHLSLKTLMGLAGDSGLSDALDAVDYINHLHVPSAGGVWLPLGGTVSFAGSGLSGILAGAPSPFQAVAATDPSTLLTDANNAVGSSFFSEAQVSTSSTSPQFVFPIVTDPEGCIRKLLAGQNADLFIFKAPTFDAHAAGSLGTNFGGVFGVQLGGAIDVNVALSMGYDTNGLKEFLGGGASDPSTLLDGFYVDNGIDPNGQHHTGVNVSGNISASASLAGATLSGGLYATGYIGLNSSAPKVYFAQIVNPPSGPLFAASGDVTASLDFEYDILGVTLFSYNIAQKTLFDFNTAVNGSSSNTTPADPNDPTIVINLQNTDQTIHVNESIQPLRSFTTESGANATVYEYAIVVDYGNQRDKYVQGDVAIDDQTTEVYWVDNAHAYTLLQTSVSDTEPTGNHTIVVGSGVVGSVYMAQGYGAHASLGTTPINAVLVGGTGNDDLEYYASGQAFLVGGGGANRLVGGQTEYGNYIWPGGGLFRPFSSDPPFPVTLGVLIELSNMVFDDGGVGGITHQVFAGVGGNTLIGTSGDDLLVGGPNGNFFDGLSGTDRVYGGIGANYYDVSGGNTGAGEAVTIDSASTNSAGVNTNEVLVHSAIPLVSGGTSLVDATIGEGDPLLYDQFVLGDTTHQTLTYSDPNSYVSVAASGISKLSVVGDGTYNIGSLDATTVWQVAINLSDPSRRDGTRNVAALPDSVTINGHSTKDVFTIDSALDHGSSLTTVQDVNPGNSYLQTTIRNLGAPDTLTLNGGGGSDLFALDLNTVAPFTTSVHDTGSNLLTADGSAFTYGATNLGTPADRFTLYEDDSIGVSGSGVDFGARLLFGASNGPLLAATSAHVGFDGSITKLVVIGGNGGDRINVNSPAPARTYVYGGDSPNSFLARANDTNITLYGGAANDTFDAGGTSTYTLDGQGGNDTYTLRWDVVNTVTIDDSGAPGQNALVIDDTGNSVNQSTLYQVTAGRIVRVADEQITFLGFPVGLEYTNTANFGNIAQITLETGDGTGAANQIDLYPLGAGTDLSVDLEQGTNHVDVIGTSPQSSTTINSGAGVDDVAVSGLEETLASIAGAVTVNGNGSTAVAVDDQETVYAESPTIYSVTPNEIQAIRSEFNGVSAYQVNPQIGYTGLSSLVVNPVLSGWPNVFLVGSTAGTASMVLNTGYVAQVVVGSSPTYLDDIGNLTVVGSGVQTSLVIDDTLGTGLPTGLPEGVTNVTSSIAYTVTDQDVQRHAGYGYALPDGGGGGASLADIHYQGINSLELDGSNLGAPFTIASTSAPTLVAGGTGPDTFTVGRSLDTIDSLRISGGGGVNALTIDDSLGTGVSGGLPPGATLVNSTVSYTVTGQDVSRASSYGYVSADGGGGGNGSLDIPYQGINVLELDAGAVGTAIDVEGTSAATTVNVGPGNTTVTVAAQSQTLDNLAGALTINGNRADSLDVQDQQSTADKTYDVTASTLGRTGIAPITYTAFANVAVHGGTGSNLLYVESTAAGTTTDVFGGTGTSLDEFWAYLYSVQGRLNLHGQSSPGGETAALLYDYLNSAPGTYTLTAGALNRTGMAPVTYDGVVEDILYTSGVTTAAVNLLSNAAGVSTYVVAGPGDHVGVGSQAPAPGSTLAAVHGAVIFSSYATGAPPSVTIDDSGDTVDRPQVSLDPYQAPYNFQLSGLGGPGPAQFIFGLDPAASVNVLLGSGNDTAKVAGSFSAPGLSLDGGGGTNTLIGPDGIATWAITGNNAGTLDGLAFVNFGNLTAGAGQNSFQFASPSASIGNVTGGQSTSTLDYSQFTTPVNVDLGDGTNGTATAVRGVVTGISAVIGGSGNDVLNAGTVPRVALTGGPGTNSLTGAAAGDRAVEWIDSNYTLTNSRITGANTGLIDNLSGITTASLTGSSVIQNAFDVSAWTGTGSLTAPLGTGTVTARKNANFTLADAALATTDGLSLSLSGVTSAALTATAANKTFTTDGWTGGGTLTGSSSQVFATKAAGFNLTNTSLSSTDGMHLALSGVGTANLTVNAPSGASLSIVDASAFIGVTNLTAAGTAHAVLFGGQGNGSTLSATGSSNSVLVGGSGKTTITDTSTGRNILIGGPKAVSLTGNGDDILVSGTTVYDSNTPGNIAALDAILAMWSSANPYSTRVNKIMGGVGTGQAYALNTSTCQANSRPVTVSDGAAPSQNNWFIVSSKDKVTSKSNETITTI